jgi:lipoprotein-anchoring transpeptidase ErfK/SrfK
MANSDSAAFNGHSPPKFHRTNVMGGLVDSNALQRRKRNREAPVAFPVQKHPRDARRMGQIMAQKFACFRRQSQRATNALIFAGALLVAPAILPGAAGAQVLGYASTPQNSFPSDNMMLTSPDPALRDDGNGSASVVPERLRRAIVAFDTREAPGTVIIDTGNTALYYVLGQGRAIRYGVGVGREGFTWSGTQTISRKAEWPDWHPPAEMIARQPYLPRFMAGGPGNPLGARAMYLGSSEYRIHGTNDPSTIGKFVSSGCIRLTNEDVADLFSRVDVGTKVVVLPKNSPHFQARAAAASVRPAITPPRPVAASGRQAMNLSAVPLY